MSFYVVQDTGFLKAVIVLLTDEGMAQVGLPAALLGGSRSLHATRYGLLAAVVM